MISSVYEALTNSCLRIFDEKKRLSWRMEADREIRKIFCQAEFCQMAKVVSK